MLLDGLIALRPPFRRGQLDLDALSAQLLDGAHAIAAVDKEALVQFDRGHRAGVPNRLDQIIELFADDQRESAGERMNREATDHLQRRLHRRRSYWLTVRCRIACGLSQPKL